MINWNISTEDMVTINEISSRVLEYVPSLDRMTLDMDITACHANGCPLDLGRLLTLSLETYYMTPSGSRNTLTGTQVN